MNDGAVCINGSSNIFFCPYWLYNDYSYICVILMLEFRFVGCIRIKCVGCWICWNHPSTRNSKDWMQYKKNVRKNIGKNLPPPWEEKWRGERKRSIFHSCLFSSFQNGERKKKNKQRNSGDKSRFLSAGTGVERWIRPGFGRVKWASAIKSRQAKRQEPLSSELKANTEGQRRVQERAENCCV